jgi:hypothetical protein
VPSACPSLAAFDPSSADDTGDTISVAAPTATPIALATSTLVSPTTGVSATDSSELCAPSLVTGELSLTAVEVSPSLT